jgi:FkbM family methyltransferase
MIKKELLNLVQKIGLVVNHWMTDVGLLSSANGQRAFARLYFAYKRYLEDPFEKLILTHPTLLRRGHIVDIGANIGYTACLFARWVDREYRVWAFEPSSENFRRLEHTLRAKNLNKRVNAVRTAIGDRTGSASLEINPSHPGDHRVRDDVLDHSEAQRLENVSISSLDSLVDALGIKPIAFIKIDVQGYEIRVLRGMAATLVSNPAASVAVEYCPEALHEAGDTPQEIFSFFSRLGYRGFVIGRGGSLDRNAYIALAEGTSERGYADLLFIPPAVDLSQ